VLMHRLDGLHDLGPRRARFGHPERVAHDQPQPDRRGERVYDVNGVPGELGFRLYRRTVW
jgi:hypothetical protein